MKILTKFLLVFLLVLPTAVLFTNRDSRLVANAEEDPVEDLVEGEEEEEEEEDADVQVEEDEEGDGDEGDAPPAETDEEVEEEEEEEPLKPSVDAETTILFTLGSEQELPAGKLIRVLVGFSNKGDQDFYVETMDASFRYPQDFSFYIQNFTTFRYDVTVQPEKQATFEYVFTPNEAFAGRPFGLVLNLNYKDAEGTVFQDAVYNETINIFEIDEGLDTETFFLYVFLIAIVVLLAVGGQQLLTNFGKKKRPAKQTIEIGTQNHSDVDYDWIPKETLAGMNKTSPRRSPRRRTKRGTGSDDK
ncbi:translocon-associated protein subunit alpha-like [Saccoglossus kowalevskii]|uniref:Translocon-associated protein subunit alpha n=1 Tax=Saccoglossus kowalevskii TaxID=10224 RepID=A0ABM0GS36_SACKO|nr:PREDICTED: translocon-associated protein subunit alpha-like [Saccoglossus kowalevskii]